MRAVMVVVVTPCRDPAAGMAQAGEQVLVQAFLPQPPMTGSEKPFCIGLPGAMQCHSTFRSRCHVRIAFDVSSVPLSETTVQGQPRIPAIRSRSSAIKDATVERFHHGGHGQLRNHFANFSSAYNCGLRLKTHKGLTRLESIRKCCTSEPDRFTIKPIPQMPGRTSQPQSAAVSGEQGNNHRSSDFGPEAPFARLIIGGRHLPTVALRQTVCGHHFRDVSGRAIRPFAHFNSR